MSGYSAALPNAAPAGGQRPAENREDDVFELTDELILGDIKPNTEATKDVPSWARPEGMVPQRPSTTGRYAEAGAPPSARPAPQAGRSQQDNSAAGQAPQQPQNSWSKRHLPDAGLIHPFSAESPSFSRPERAPRLDTGTSTSITPDSRWAGDFQAPVPEDGPAPFAASAAPQDMDDEPAMTETIGRLAKSAVSALDDEELAEATKVDFHNIRGENRSAVTQSFARAVSQGDSFANPFATPQAPAEEITLPDIPGEDLPSASRAPAASLPERYPAADAAHAPIPLRPSGNMRLQQSGSLPPAPFASASPTPLSPQGGRTLEDSVREMLRPLLVEWLNANMPRILEDAIRQEIKTRGLPWDPTRNG
jgi:cell pole-organizing protein PopZ